MGDGDQRPGVVVEQLCLWSEPERLELPGLTGTVAAGPHGVRQVDPDGEDEIDRERDARKHEQGLDDAHAEDSIER